MSNPAFIMELPLKANQEAAAFLPPEQNRELPQIARDRRDIKQIELQLKQPEHSLISRVAEDQQTEYRSRPGRGKREQSI